MLKHTSSVLKFYSRRFLSFKNVNAVDWVKHEKILMEPFDYIYKVPSKFHPLMATSFNSWLKVPEQKVNLIQVAMQSAMAWTILFDDIQDDSAFRYGVPAAHQVFGVGLTINAAIRALLLGQEQMRNLGHPLAPEIYLKVLDDYVYGQGIDIYWRDNYICPTAEEHIDMTKKKSGSWFILPVALLQLFSSNKTEYTDLATDIGIYHHLVDDYFNLFDHKALAGLAQIKQDNHTLCSDITECKITLPVIHASQFPDVATELADILKQRTSDPKLKSRAIELLKKHGSDEYTRDALKKLEVQIRAKVDRFGGNAILSKMMDDLSVY